MRRRSGEVAATLLSAVVTTAVFFTALGAAEHALGGRLDPSLLADLAAEKPVAERTHTRFDPDLGWSNVPNLALPDFYGPGLGFTTNSFGFRGPELARAGRERVVCSGDSFTLGYGVGDADTWCASFGRLARMESVNMGQGGYGVDQAYLWYERDGAALEPDLHVFAFTYVDFERMAAPSFFGYAKPSLAVGPSGALEVTPPGEAAADSRGPSWFSRAAIALHRLKTVQYVERLTRRHFLEAAPEPSRRTAVAAIERLDRLQKSRKKRFVAVYLPTPMDREPTRLDGLREYLAAELKSRGVEFVDLVPDFREFKSERHDALFFDGEGARFLGADGHYTREGNAVVARLLLERLGVYNAAS